jgi:predicted Asp-tRNA(Asn)/Glu-tRNA(Gln) amidotransferase subunit C
MDKEKIRRESKNLLDKFANVLEKVEKEKDVDFHVEMKEFERKEGDGKEPDSDFRGRMLENAPEKDSDLIIAEKGRWK